MQDLRNLTRYIYIKKNIGVFLKGVIFSKGVMMSGHLCDILRFGKEYDRIAII